MSLGGLALGLALAAVTAGLAYRAGALARGGALGAVLVGGLTFAGGGLAAALLLIAFFATSSGLSRLGGWRKQRLGEAFSQRPQRNLAQVLANGGVAAGLALLHGLRPEARWLAGLTGALAAAAADTWATEVGMLFGRWPRLVTTGRQVPPGTSGGVTLEGTLASLAGAALLAGLGGALLGDGALAVGAWAGGVAGALVDSLLGATLQAVYRCPACGQETEQHPLHRCGETTHPARGWCWMNNDTVNLLATVTGALVAIGWTWK